MRALRNCTTSGCAELTKAGKCDSCKHTAAKQRNNETSKAYNTLWRTCSQAFLLRFPQCFTCGKPGKHVDHIDGQGPAGPSGYDWDNLQTLCISCHSKKTYQQDGAFGRWYT